MSAIATARQLLSGAVRELLPSVQQLELDAAQQAGWKLDEPAAYCHRCAASAGPGAVTPRGCRHCADQRLPWQSAVRLGPYTKPLSQWILAMKFGKQWAWANWFGRTLARQLCLPDSPDQTVVCYVPMHWRRRWRRGYNQAQLMAAALAKQHHWQVADVLTRIRHTQPQTHVPPSGRHANVRRSFAVAPVDLAGYRVVLVDDVKTSGATLTTCARLLRKAGAKSIHIAVAAVAEHGQTHK